MLTIGALVSAGIKPTAARIYIEPLLAACARFEIDSAVRQAAFVAQCCVESEGFTALEEGLYYRYPDRLRDVFRDHFRTPADAMPYTRAPEKLANFVYSNRNGNGPPKPPGEEALSDGWRFRGSGLIQITGRTNFQLAASMTGRPYVEQPELVRKPEDAAMSAAAWWAARKLNLIADACDWDTITKRVNGTRMLKKDERRQMTQELLYAFSQASVAFAPAPQLPPPAAPAAPTQP